MQTGTQLDLSDEAITKRLLDDRIYSRYSPTHAILEPSWIDLKLVYRAGMNAAMKEMALQAKIANK